MGLTNLLPVAPVWGADPPWGWIAAGVLLLAAAEGALVWALMVRPLRTLRAQVAERDERLARREADFRAQAEQLKDSNRYLQTFADKLREMNRLKSEFLANMSHELRSPLNSILGYAELLLEENPSLDEQQRRDLTVIRKHALSLLQIINDLLDISKIEAGQVTFVLERFELGALLREDLDAVRPLAGDKRLDFALELPDDFPPLVSDRQKVHQVLFNLLTNAVKFTEEGRVSVAVRLLDQPPQEAATPAGDGAMPGGPFVEIDVRDTGVGIDPGDLDEIFLEFRQGDGSATRRFGGTGLGLAIAKKYVTMLCGTLTVDSRPGEGSTFRVRLPLTIEERQVRAPARRRTTALHRAEP